MKERLRRITNNESRIIHEREDTRDGVRSRHRPRDSCAALDRVEDVLRLPGDVRRATQHANLPCLPGPAGVAAGPQPEGGRPGAAHGGRAGCTMHPTSQFHRKNYYYPDLPKNYQITQYRYKVHPPLATDGSLAIPGRRIGIRRVHLEEDTGRLVHAEERGQVRYSLVDFNRSGVPLMEIVTEPDLRSPQEARIFLARLRAVLQAIEVSTGLMEEGSLRCDANVSLRRPGAELGIRTEVKNMNSLRSVERALAYEVERQRAVLDRGQPVQQETRHWDEHRGITFSSRTKEEAQDYRYFPEPDLVPIDVAPQWVAQIRASLPELPEAKRRRYVE